VLHGVCGDELFDVPVDVRVVIAILDRVETWQKSHYTLTE
jgi:hypothetical protein